MDMGQGLEISWVRSINILRIVSVSKNYLVHSSVLTYVRISLLKFT